MQRPFGEDNTFIAENLPMAIVLSVHMVNLNHFNLDTLLYIP